MADAGDDDDDDDEEVILSELLDISSLLSLTLLMCKFVVIVQIVGTRRVVSRQLFLEQFFCNLSLHSCAVTMFGIRQQIFLD